MPDRLTGVNRRNMKKICVVTSTRAEYGVLKNTMREIEREEQLSLCLIVTGMHLLPAFGNTVSEIEEDGFFIAERVPVEWNTDTPAAASRIMGELMLKLADVFERHRPDMLLAVGDRFEMLSICSCALNMQIPIAHISGGELTEGAVDDCIRHCITKMSTLHFPGCERYRQRIIQLGEQPDTVFNYGDVGVENILKTDMLGHKELEADLGISLDKYICVTFHPVTTQLHETEKQMTALLRALSHFPEIQIIVTKANGDAGGDYINRIWEDYERQHENCHLFSSLGIRRYLSLLRGALAVVGNSSSGIIEAPTLKIPTVNIGDRQKGREQASSVVNCLPLEEDIVSAMNRAFSEEGQQTAKQTESPYASGNTSEKIVEEIIRYFSKENAGKAKKFYDIIIPANKSLS